MSGRTLTRALAATFMLCLLGASLTGTAAGNQPKTALPQR